MFCQKCGKEIPEGTGRVVDEHLLCPDCAKAAVKCYCQRCGCELPGDTPAQESGRLLCEKCAKLPDDSQETEAYFDPDGKRPHGTRLPMLPVWIAALSLIVVVGAVAALFGTKTLCFHDWQPATCEVPEICTKCGRSHGDPLPHKWKEATCTEPQTCMICGKTEGEPLGHSWLDPTCVAPKTCMICGETEGKPLGHKWEPATCQAPMTCSVCGETKGEPGEHQWLDATCEEPRTCELCGETEGEALGHTWVAATCTEPKTCEVCGKTEGEPAGHKWKEATVLAPKTCEVCGETEGKPLRIRDLLPFDLMGVAKSDFIGATTDAHHEPIGCDYCADNRSTLVSDLFPGCVLAYGESSESTPSHIHVFDGNVTSDTHIGMTYKELTEALGTPAWSLNEAENTAIATYTIDGQTVGFVFNDKKVIDAVVRYLSGRTQTIRITKTSMKVVAARIGE